MLFKKFKSSIFSQKLFGILLGISGFLIPQFFQFEGLSVAGHIVLGIFFMAAVFWIFETIPIYSTSLLIILLQVLLLSQQGILYSDVKLPLINPEKSTGDTWILPKQALSDDMIVLIDDAGNQQYIEVNVVEMGESVRVAAPGLSESSTVVSDYGHRLVGYEPVSFTKFISTLANPIIILFLGGFMLARGAVKYNLDKNITSLLLRPFGEKPVFIVLGLMLVTAALSAFMSNTATTAMMMTVAIPIAMQVSRDDKFRIMLILSIPFAAGIGGMVTPIGTPPNAIVIANLQQQGIDIAFGTWTMLMFPLSALLLVATWGALQVLFPPAIKRFTLELTSSFDKSPKAIILYVLFGITVLLWITESSHGIPNAIVAFIPITGLAVTNVLKIEDIRSLPWEVLWLVAGGIALGLSMEDTGLAQWLVAGIGWEKFPQIGLLLVLGLVALTMSIFLSNTVTATLLIPLAMSLGGAGAGGDGISVVISSLIIGAACNMAMILPISTPPNAIAMSSGFIKTVDMIKAGTLLAIVGMVIALVLALVYWPIFVE